MAAVRDQDLILSAAKSHLEMIRTNAKRSGALSASSLTATRARTRITSRRGSTRYKRPGANLSLQEDQKPPTVRPTPAQISCSKTPRKSKRANKATRTTTQGILRGTIAKSPRQLLSLAVIRAQREVKRGHPHRQNRLKNRN